MDRADLCKGSILAPTRSSIAGVVIILSVVVVLSLAMLWPDRAAEAVLVVLAMLLLMAIVSKSVFAIHFTVFGLIWISLLRLFPFHHNWPFSLMVPLLAYGVVVSLVPHLRRSVGWLRRGSFGNDVRLLAATIVIISSAALFAWYWLAAPDLSAQLALVPDIPVWALPIAALGFAATNAAMEEAVFRGIMMEAVDSAVGAGLLSVVVQAVSFGAFHYVAGIPNGAWGFAMTFVYGVMLGAVRRRSRGMLAPWAAHVMADVTIFGILVTILVSHEGLSLA